MLHTLNLPQVVLHHPAVVGTCEFRCARVGITLAKLVCLQFDMLAQQDQSVLNAAIKFEVGTSRPAGPPSSTSGVGHPNEPCSSANEPAGATTEAPVDSAGALAGGDPMDTSSVAIESADSKLAEEVPAVVSAYTMPNLAS